MKNSDAPLLLPSDPFLSFQQWFTEAQAAQIKDVNAMTLASLDAQGFPQARTVLLKGVGPEGFEFYTNYQSKKGQELLAHPKASLLFFWKELHRQIRVTGHIKKLSRAASEAYFSTRPRASQIGAWASPQSQPIGGRADLLHRVQEIENRFRDVAVPCPPHWGGFGLSPITFEFWEERPHRLHERLIYVLQGDHFQQSRVAP